MHIHSKLFWRTFVVGTSSDLGRPFRPWQKRWGLGWEESRFSRYDIHAEGALPPRGQRLNFILSCLWHYIYCLGDVVFID